MACRNRQRLKSGGRAAGPVKGREEILKNDADSAWKSEIILACSTVLVQNPSGALCHPWNIRVPVVTLFGERTVLCMPHHLLKAASSMHR